MFKDETIKEIAESLRGTHAKMNALSELTGFEVYEYFHEIDGIFYVLLDLLDVPPGDANSDILHQYLNGGFDYDELLSRIKDAQEEFDPVAYERYLEMYERVYGEGGGTYVG